ncbi:MAG: hypothetical protein ABIT83_08155, partial [Massilia sp.]
MDASTGLDYVRGKISATEYWSAVFPLSAFDDLCCGHPEWAAHLRSVVDSGFWRLHALDRADSFWRNTNRLATVGKLHEFAAYESQKEQDNVDAAWLSIAMSLFGGADHLEPAPWKILLRAAAVDARFLMCTAFSTSAYWTD